MNAIETSYKGFRFRSRLEARMAIFLDTLRVEWDYERQGYSLPSGPYLLDFWLPYRYIPEIPDAGEWLEIKPEAATPREIQLFAELVEATGHRGFLFCG